VFLVGNPVPSANGDEAQIFIFPGTDEPLFTDFLYVAYSVALTFAMSDVDLEDGFARGVVLVQAIVSYLFYSTIFSMVTTLIGLQHPQPTSLDRDGRSTAGAPTPRL